MILWEGLGSLILSHKGHAGNQCWTCMTFELSGITAGETFIPPLSIPPHGPENKLQNKCLQMQSTAADRNVAWNCITEEGSPISSLCRRTCKQSGQEFISDGQKDSGHVLWGQMSPHFSLHLGEERTGVLRCKDEKGPPGCCQWKVQVSSSVIVCGWFDAHGVHDLYVCTIADTFEETCFPWKTIVISAGQ